MKRGKPAVGGSMRLKRAARPKNVGKTKEDLYRLTVGSPNTQSPPKAFDSEVITKNNARKFFMSMQATVGRINPPGLAAIEAAIIELDGLPAITQEVKVITALIDESTGTVLVAKLWRV